MLTIMDIVGRQNFWPLIARIRFVSDDCIEDKPGVFAWLRLEELSGGTRFRICSYCDETAELYLCGGSCYRARAYCRRKCQKKHWKEQHHKDCRRIKDEAHVDFAGYSRKEDRRARE